MSLPLAVRSIQCDHATSGYIHLRQRGDRLVEEESMESTLLQTSHSILMRGSFLVCMTLGL